jgi:hypothetical protein
MIVCRWCGLRYWRRKESLSEREQADKSRIYIPSRWGIASMKRTRFAAATFCVFLAPSLAFATTCPTTLAKAEIGARYLVTEFMVAALSCRNDPAFRDSYASFVRRYNPGLVGNAQALKASFGGGSALDSYVTRLANHAALRQNDGPYCSHARLRIDRALAAEKTASLVQVIETLGYSQGGPACGDNTPVAALANKAPIGGGKLQPAAATAPAKAAAAPAAQMAPGAPPTPAAAPQMKAEDVGAETAPLPAAGGGTDLSPTP